ncbi:MAG: hypothetical protein ACREBT_02090 [Thermoplasmata archaeon]
MSSPTPASNADRIAAPIIAAILLVAAALLFTGIYLVWPQNGHAFALILIGIVGVIFAVVAYLLQSTSSDGSFQRGAAWGFYAFGFAVLLLTFGLNPSGYLSLAWQYISIVLTLVILAASIALIAWRYRSVAEVAPREAERAAWRESTPPSAFDYSTAHAPSAPVTAPSPVTKGPPPSGGA